MPTVSVIIPTFNRGDVILNALKSVLDQTYKEFEIIVVDDGSTDDTVDKLRPYMDRIRYVYQRNQGASAAQNTGIELAVGKWISILASDDLWLPTKLEREVHTLARFGDEFGACFTNCSFFGDPALRLSAFEHAGLSEARKVGALADPMPWVFVRQGLIFVQSLMVSRSLLEPRPFDEEMIVSEDTDLIFRLALKTRFCFVNEVLVGIDRTPDRKRLMNLFSRKDERVFLSREHMFKKWLGLREEIDPSTRRRISESLKELYYDWAILGLYQWSFGKAFGKARLVRVWGDQWRAIIKMFLFRALRKARFALQGSMGGFAMVFRWFDPVGTTENE